MAKQKIPHLSCEDVVPLEDLIRDALTAQADEGKAMAGFRSCANTDQGRPPARHRSRPSPGGQDSPLRGHTNGVTKV